MIIVEAWVRVEDAAEIDRWRDEAALSAHFTTPHMAVFGKAMASAKITAALIKAYSGEVVRTLMER